MQCWCKRDNVLWVLQSICFSHLNSLRMLQLTKQCTVWVWQVNKPVWNWWGNTLFWFFYWPKKPSSPFWEIPWTCPGHNQETSTFTECQYTIFSPHLPGPRYLYTAWKVSQLLKPMLKCAVLLMDFKFLSMNCFLMRFVNCCWTCFSCDLRSLIPFSNSAILLSLLMMVSVE